MLMMRSQVLFESHLKTDTKYAVWSKIFDFDKFFFYIEAVEKYPKISWPSDAKEDVNGTGADILCLKGCRCSKQKETHCSGSRFKREYPDKEI